MTFGVESCNFFSYLLVCWLYGFIYDSLADIVIKFIFTLVLPKYEWSCGTWQKGKKNGLDFYTT